LFILLLQFGFLSVGKGQVHNIGIHTRFMYIRATGSPDETHILRLALLYRYIFVWENRNEFILQFSAAAGFKFNITYIRIYYIGILYLYIHTDTDYCTRCYKTTDTIWWGRRGLIHAVTGVYNYRDDRYLRWNILITL